MNQPTVSSLNMTQILPKVALGLAIAAVTAVLAYGGSADAKKATNPVTSGYGKDQCKNGGWQALGYRNQGQCVSFFAKAQH